MSQSQWEKGAPARNCVHGEVQPPPKLQLMPRSVCVCRHCVKVSFCLDGKLIIGKLSLMVHVVADGEVFTRFGSVGESVVEQVESGSWLSRYLKMLLPTSLQNAYR